MSGAPDAAIARRLRLRGWLPSPVRLSRRTLVALAAVTGLALAAVIAWSLSPHAPRHAAPAGPALATAAPPGAITALPADYAALPKPPPPPPDAPRLGPPLPGDLGRPILAAEGGAPAGSVGARPPDSARPEASRLFAAAEPAPEPAAAPAVAPPATVVAAASSEPATTDRRNAFVSATPASRVDSAHLQPPASPYVLQAGTAVPAVLVTGIRSDLPGPVIAQVSEDVYDSVAGRYLLIPQGSRLLGTYDAQVRFGQQRVQVVWTRLILPDGRSLDLAREPAGDTEGYAGLSDQVDRKWKQIGGAAAVSTLLGVGVELGAGSGDSQLVQALRNGAANGVNQAGQQIVGKSLDIQPTLTIRPGLPVRLLLTHDLVLSPWPGAEATPPDPAAME